MCTTTMQPRAGQASFAGRGGSCTVAGMDSGRGSRESRTVAGTHTGVGSTESGRGASGFVAILLLALALAHIRYLWFVCDDAYITFRYASNLAHGLGPVWNAGERVEGYTN